MLFFVLCTNVFALTWNEAVSLAEQNSHELRSSRKQLESSEWTYRKAISAFLPQLSAGASMTESLTPTTSASSKTYKYDLSATQYLFKGTEGLYGIQSAYANVEYQKANLRSTQASVFYDLRSAFIEVLYTQEEIKLLEKILEDRKENTRLIQLRYESGKEDKGNLMTTQADQAKAEYDLASARRNLKLAKLKLSQLLQSGVEKVEEKDGFKKPSAVDFDKLLEESPSYVIARKQLQLAELSQKASISGFLPSLYLKGNYKKSGPDWPPEEENKSWSLNLSYSFFPGGSNIAERAISGAELDQAQEDFEQSVNDLRYSLEQEHEDYVDALEALELAKVSLAASKERAKITTAKYLNGLAIYDEWYRIENNYIRAKTSLLTAKKSALLAEANWHKTYGGYVK